MEAAATPAGVALQDGLLRVRWPPQPQACDPPVPRAHAGLPPRKPHIAHPAFTGTCARFVGGPQIAAGRELPEGQPFGEGERGHF